jgi:branched-chain amino acid transport system permease protein
VASTAQLTSEAKPNSPPSAPPRLERGFWPRAGIIGVLVVAVIILLPQILSLYYIDAMTQVAIYSVVALGLGVLVGRVGLISLGQAAVLAIGAWVAARILFATSLPYEVVLLAAGVITMLLGTLVGLPALRMRGLYLALITLMLAGAITIILASLNFPNGGHGFSGYNGALLHIPPIRRPGIAQTDPAYFRYSVVAAVIMFLIVLIHVRTKPGRAWAAIRQSEPAALAAGINTTLYKLWAFALASFITSTPSTSRPRTRSFCWPLSSWVAPTACGGRSWPACCTSCCPRSSTTSGSRLIG